MIITPFLKVKKFSNVMMSKNFINVALKLGINYNLCFKCETAAKEKNDADKKVSTDWRGFSIEFYEK